MTPHSKPTRLTLAIRALLAGALILSGPLAKGVITLALDANLSNSLTSASLVSGDVNQQALPSLDGSTQGEDPSVSAAVSLKTSW